MKVRLYMMVQDPRFAPVHGAKRRIEGYEVMNIEFINGGPKTDRVAVVDIDAQTGKRVAEARLLAPTGKKKLSKFDLPAPAKIDPELRTFNQVSVLATVLKTIALYEDADGLGRPVGWAFEGPLTIIPRIGARNIRDLNACYSRKKKRLLFYYFTTTQVPAETVYTSLSRDVVAHETGHAILDGIAPHLKNVATATPQSLALHEAIGDITGLLIALASDNLRKEVLAKTKGSILNATDFSAIGEQVGTARGNGVLRDLCNWTKLSEVHPQDLYGLSKVLTGALYHILIKMYLKCWKELVEPTGNKAIRSSKSGLALYASSQQFKRMTLRALDYLPPGQNTFADYARAVIAADQTSHPDNKEVRQWLVEEFKRREIVDDEAALTVTAPDIKFEDVDLGLLVCDDDQARLFAEKHRNLLRIPEQTDFIVEPRLEACKKYYHRSECQEGQSKSTATKECLFKVSWQDPNSYNRTKGTTLAIDWRTRRLRVLLTSDHSDRPEEEEALQADLAGFSNRELGIACFQ